MRSSPSRLGGLAAARRRPFQPRRSWAAVGDREPRAVITRHQPVVYNGAGLPGRLDRVRPRADVAGVSARSSWTTAPPTAPRSCGAELRRSAASPITRNATNLGLVGNSSARCCSELADGSELVCIWHHDGVMLPTNLARKVAFLDAHPRPPHSCTPILWLVRTRPRRREPSTGTRPRGATARHWQGAAGTEHFALRTCTTAPWSPSARSARAGAAYEAGPAASGARAAETAVTTRCGCAWRCPGDVGRLARAPRRVPEARRQREQRPCPTGLAGLSTSPPRGPAAGERPRPAASRTLTDLLERVRAALRARGDGLRAAETSYQARFAESRRFSGAGRAACSPGMLWDPPVLVAAAAGGGRRPRRAACTTASAAASPAGRSRSRRPGAPLMLSRAAPRGAPPGRLRAASSAPTATTFIAIGCGGARVELARRHPWS